MKLNLLKHIIFYLMISFSLSFSQSIEELEKEIMSLKEKITSEQTKLDSLNLILLTNNQKINQKNNTSSEKKNLLVKSANVSEKIEEKNSLINHLQNSYDLLKEKLFIQISEKLVVLKERGDNETISHLTTKQIIYAPVINQLKYDPEYLLNISKNDIEDLLTKELVDESLTAAIKEVDQQLGKIVSVHKEFTEIAELNQLANEFTEEVEFNSDISSFRSVTIESSRSEDKNNIYDEIKNEGLNSLNAVVTQLNVKELGQMENNSSLFTKLLKNTNLSDYLSYLEEVKAILGKYKNILIQKKKGLNE